MAYPGTKRRINSKPLAALQPSPYSNANRGRILAVSILLVLLVLLVFCRTLGCGFVFDDAVYVSGNPVVQKGLTWDGFCWALIYGDIGHWHPLTWLSHMLDCQLYGLNPVGHHLTNLLLHTATVILLFLVLQEMTGAVWRSAVVAAVFAIHPLRVESMAWVAERKDVLSAFFFMLTLGAYYRYVRQPSTIRYTLVMLCFALGLLSKNMLVTLPFVLLLLDYWPLRRIKNAESRAGDFARLIMEKIPLLLLAFGSCVMTFLTPEKVAGDLRLPFGLRLENALVSYVTYIEQMIYPAGLTCLYPNPRTYLPPWQLTGALALLIAMSVAVWACRKRRPWLVVGWLWYLGMLIPVIGIVQISYYAHADRYTYLPQIGLYVAIVWIVADLAGSWRYRRQILVFMSSIIIIGLSACTWRQIAYWRNDEALWKRAIACTRGNYIAQNNLGYDLAARGQTEEAVEHYQKALEINPDSVDCNNNLGTALLRQGNLNKALECFRHAVAVDPAFAEAHNNMAIVLARQGRVDEAIEQYERAIALEPDRAEFHNNFGDLLSRRRQTARAIEQFQKALELDPAYAKARENLANLFFAQSRWPEAAEQYRQELQQTPNLVHARYQLGLALECLGESRNAISEFRKVLELAPNHVTAQNDLAWILATCSDASLRNGSEAVELAEQAVRLSAGTSPQILDTLAAAYAEAGRFPEAVATARRALDLSTAQNNKALTDDIQGQLELFQRHSAYHEKP